MDLAHAAPGRVPSSAHPHLEGAGSLEPGWLLSAQVNPEESGGNGYPHSEHLQVVEGHLVLVIWAGKGMSSLPAQPKMVTTVRRSGRETDRWGQQCGSMLQCSAVLPY